MPNILSNSWQIVKNKANSLVQNPDSLKNESLILASLALVISRIIIANVSAVNARGTSEGPYRYRESIRTTIREVCGWTLGFMVLRAIQAKLRAKIGSHLGVKAAEDKNSYSLFGSFLNMLKKPGDKVNPINLDLAQSLEPTYNKAVQKNYVKTFLGSDFARNLIRNRFGGQEEKFVKFLYKVCPIAIASIPTVALAGYALERFTRDHSDKVVDFVSGSLNKGAVKIQSGAGQVQAQVMQYSQAIPFRGFTGQPYGMHLQSPFHFSKSMAQPTFQATSQSPGMQAASPAVAPVVPSVVSPAVPLASPQFAGRHRAIRPRPVTRSNGFAV